LQWQKNTDFPTYFAKTTSQTGLSVVEYLKHF